MNKTNVKSFITLGLLIGAFITNLMSMVTIMSIFRVIFNEEVQGSLKWDLGCLCFMFFFCTIYGILAMLNPKDAYFSEPISRLFRFQFFLAWILMYCIVYMILSLILSTHHLAIASTITHPRALLFLIAFLSLLCSIINYTLFKPYQ